MAVCVPERLSFRTMRTIRRIAIAAIGLSLALALAAPAAATHGGIGRHVPFHLVIAGADRPLDMAPGMPPFITPSTFDGRCSVPSTWVATIDSRGTAEHLGAVSVFQQHCTRFPFFDPAPQRGVFDDGRMVVTTANGDELWVQYRGYFDFYPLPDRPDIGTSLLTYGPMTIVGGTGRFAHATGAFSGSAIDAFGSGGNTARFDGWIAYDASDRAAG
jgi:hypothetical protein